MTQDQHIFIKNIYYMLSYAFTSLHSEAYESIDKEEFEHIHDLLAAILAKGIAHQLKQGLYREYIPRQEELSVLRGKVDLPAMMKNRNTKRRRITCEYDELSENNLLNQILKTTAMLLLRCPEVRLASKRALKKEMLFFGQVNQIQPELIRWEAVRYERNNQHYRLLIGICRLVLEGLLMTTEKGETRLASFLDDQRMYQLYEAFLRAYYLKEHPELDEVSAAHVSWITDDGFTGMLPTMRSDITLRKGKKILIIDAKYYQNILQTHFEKESIRSGNIYQIFTYVKNKAAEVEPQGGEVSGMLLYAGTDTGLQPKESYRLSGNRIGVDTLDLNQEFKEIRRKLDEIARDGVL